MVVAKTLNVVVEVSEPVERFKAPPLPLWGAPIKVFPELFLNWYETAGSEVAMLTVPLAPKQTAEGAEMTLLEGRLLTTNDVELVKVFVHPVEVTPIEVIERDNALSAEVRARVLKLATPEPFDSNPVT